MSNSFIDSMPVYDLGSAGIAVIEAALVKEQAEHQTFRAAVAEALAELRAQAEAGAEKWFGRHNEANIYQDFADSILTTISSPKGTAVVHAAGEFGQVRKALP